MVWHDFLTPVFQPLLALGPFWAVLVISFIISLIIIIAYKYLTNQAEMKRLKEEQKEMQKKIKTLKDNPTEMMKVQKEAMGKNWEYMKHSFKPTLITMLPIIIIFGWMNAHLAYEPIYPNEMYSVSAVFEKGAMGKVELVPDKETELVSEAEQEVNSEVSWKLKSKTEGYHILEIKYGEQPYTKKVLVTKEFKYEEPWTTFSHSELKQIQIDYNNLKPLGPGFSILGWQPGWLGLYIIFSLVFSLALRKILKIY